LNSKKPNSVEEEVLLQCTRNALKQTDRGELKKLLSKENLKWTPILKQASKQGVSPLLYHCLKSFEGELVSAKTLGELKKIYYATLARNIALYSELEKILDSFARAGIEVILLKGAAFATTLYGDIGLRPMKDLDILIHKSDLEKAKTAVSSLGYSLDPSLLSLLKKGLPVGKYYLLHHPHLPPYYKKKGRIFLEVHWTLTSRTMPFKFDTPGLWERAVGAEISERRVRVLSTEDALVYMCTHIARHRFSANLREYHDLLMLTRTTVNWNRVADLACENNLKTPVYYALQYTSQLFKTTAPDKYTDRLKPGALRTAVFKSILGASTNRVFANSESDAGLLIDLLLIDRTTDQIRFLAEKIFPPILWMSIKYQAHITKTNIAIYYLRRIGYLTSATLRYPITSLIKRFSRRRR